MNRIHSFSNYRHKLLVEDLNNIGATAFTMVISALNANLLPVSHMHVFADQELGVRVKTRNLFDEISIA